MRRFHVKPRRWFGWGLIMVATAGLIITVVMLIITLTAGGNEWQLAI